MFKGLDTPRSLDVALIAFATAESRLQVIFVMIRVTGEAGLLSQLGKIVLGTTFALGSVAFFTGNLSVFADQLVARFTLMIKFGVFPAHIVVAGATLFVCIFFCEKVNVVFLVAFLTGGAEPEKVDVVFARFLIPSLFGMALGTGDFGVGTMKVETRLAVIKFLRIHIGRVMAAAFVIVVTGDTRTLGQTMERMPLLDGLLDLDVTSKTFAVWHTLARIVALETVAVLQIFVTGHQRAGSE